jgi:hypothetical protein
MAKDDDDDKDDALSPDDKLHKLLEARRDPSKISSLVRSQEASRGQKLDLSQRSRFERRLGVDLGDVRIFSGELAEEITRAHNAEALTVGDTGMVIMGGSSKYAPGGALGTSLLAHELTHVAQARPSAISRKGVEADLAEEDESEEEAEAHEAEVLAEEQGSVPPKAHAGEDDKKDEERKAAILEKVLELYEDDMRTTQMRLGMAYDPER